MLFEFLAGCATLERKHLNNEHSLINGIFTVHLSLYVTYKHLSIIQLLTERYSDVTHCFTKTIIILVYYFSIMYCT